MSITNETAMEHINDYAITCCRFEAGTIIDPSNLEDPNIIPDLEVSGLLVIPENCLKIGEVLGAKLKKTINSLTPLTEEYLDEIIKINDEKEIDNVQDSEISENIKQDNIDISSNSSSVAMTDKVKIHIGEGKDISLEIPLILANNILNANAKKEPIFENQNQTSNNEQTIPEKYEEKVVRKLVRKHFKIDNVEFGLETKIEGTTLYIRKDICGDAIDSQDLVVNMKIDIITPDKYGEYSNTIMDVQPIATKEEGELGEGITRVIDGAIVIVTGVDERGVQIGEFGSSEGRLDRNIMWGRPGSPEKGEIFIKTEIIIKSHKNMERPGPMAAHRATDVIVQEVREALKNADEELAVSQEEFVQKRRPGKKKIAIIKEIMGQGAMHDNFLIPVEPVGTLGAKANVDLGNVPVVVSPLQILDGCIHALTCIGPASKETSRHYWREPLVLKAMGDEELDLAAVILVGSPQANSEKFYVSSLLGMAVETMDLDGAIITTEGFGNNHVDFASHVEQVGKRGVSVVAMTYAAIQGQLVVGNKYMDALIDLNKSKQGIENEILENNCLSPEDAIRAIYMLKAKMAGEEIKPPERQWNANVKLNNIEIIEKATGQKIELEPNETSLEKSKKRREIYEKEELNT